MDNAGDQRVKEEEESVPAVERQDLATGNLNTTHKADEATSGAATNTPDDAQSLQTSVQQLADRALAFLSEASNETIGACLVGLGASTYLVLGRVGLVLMGVVGGVALHATWERHVDDHGKSAEEKRRREVGMDVMQRVLKWRDGSDKQEEVALAKVIPSLDRTLDFSSFRPETAAALEELTDAVIRDYVKWWYSPVLPTENLFPSTCRQTLISFLLGLSNHMSRKRPADLFLDFATNSSSILTVFLNELSSAVSASPNTPVDQAIATYLRSKPDSNLANLLDTANQEKKLTVVSEDILECYLDPRTIECEPARVFLQQILAKVILEMTITSCSKPEFINGWIVYLLEEGEPELLKEIDPTVGEPTGLNVEKTREQTASSASAEAERERVMKHKRVRSQAQEAMDDAMREAQRLSQMIAEHEAQRLREVGDVQGQDSLAALEGRTSQSSSAGPNPVPQNATPSPSTVLKDDASESTTQDIHTPSSSSQGDHTEDRPRISTSQRSSSDDDAVVITTEEATAPAATSTFTSFDQLPAETLAKPQPAELTLHNAKISVFDGSDPSNRQAMRQKPTVEYMIQIEPASSAFGGWMIIRRYADFENLHEVLGRIAKISGATVFAKSHAQLPNWKGSTESHLREELERYLMDAVRFSSLAESGGMKLFLEKEQATSKADGGGKGFGWPTPSDFESVGKGMFDALAKAPKGVAGGGKALIGGVTGVLTGGVKKQSNVSATGMGSPRAPTTNSAQASSRTSTSATRPAATRLDSALVTPSMGRPSTDSYRTSSPVIDTQPGPVPLMDSRPPSVSMDERPSRPASLTKSDTSNSIPVLGGDQIIDLPPPPSEIPDDWDQGKAPPARGVAILKSTTASGRSSMEGTRPLEPSISTPVSSSATSAEPAAPTLPPRTKTSTTIPTTPKPTQTNTPSPSPQKATTTAAAAAAAARIFPPISTEETTMLISLLFATITELYTLSSAWSLRRTLLTAAKTYLLRPGNPQLASIRTLVQDSVLDSLSADASIAGMLRSARANSLPTATELAAWPVPATQTEQDALRIKARKLLTEKGMPAALTGVMGLQASGEAVGKVFDALQVESVARGVVFGLLLQGLRGVTA